MTPEESYERYKGRKCRVDDRLPPTYGIVVGYTLFEDAEFNLIMAITETGYSVTEGWFDISDEDRIFSAFDNLLGYEYVNEEDIIFIKFGH